MRTMGRPIIYFLSARQAELAAPNQLCAKRARCSLQCTRRGMATHGCRRMARACIRLRGERQSDDWGSKDWNDDALHSSNKSLAREFPCRPLLEFPASQDP